MSSIKRCCLFSLFLLFGIITFFPSPISAAGCGLNIDPVNPAGFPTVGSVAGSSWVRIEFKDCSPENADGSSFRTTMANYRSIIQGYNSGNIGVVLLLDYATYPNAAASVQEFAERAGIIAGNYSGLNVVYEIWNEPDLSNIVSLTVDQYVDLLRASARSIKNAGGTVITGGIGNGNPGWIGSVRSAMGSDWNLVDGVGIHPYGANPDPSSSDCNIVTPYGNLPDFINSSLSNGGNKPLWITEFGLDTTDQTLQARYLTCYYRRLNSYGSQVRAALWYSWSDGMGPNWGIVTTSNSAKLAHTAFFSNACNSSPPSEISQQSALIIHNEAGQQCISSTAPLPQNPPGDDFTRLKYPCDTTTPNEYHPLRPYPFSPCDPFIPKKSQMTFQCGNPVNVSGNLGFPYVLQNELASLPVMDPNNVSQTAIPWSSQFRGHYSAGTNADNQVYQCGNQVCAIQRIPFDITVDLTPAQLPVIGFTQGDLDDPTKVNSYLSWYLNGVIDQSERQPLNNTSPTDIGRIINFSGPIKKLLSRDTQDALRYTIYYHGDDIHNYLISNRGQGGTRLHDASAVDPDALRQLLGQVFTNIPLSSFEDVVGEVIVSVIPDDFHQPTDDGPYLGAGGVYGNKNSLTLHIKRTDTLATPASDGRIYMPHIRETAFLSDLLRTYANPDTNNNLNPLPTSIPLDPNPHTRPDAVSRIFATYDKNSHKGLAGGDDTIVQVVWGEGGWNLSPSSTYETPTRNTEIIDNIDQISSHNEVVREGVTYNFPPEQIDQLSQAPAPAAPIEVIRSHNAQCGLDGYSVSIPGDNLADTNGWAINARVTYTGVFQYDPIPPPLIPVGSPCCNDSGSCSAPSNCGDSQYYSCDLQVCTPEMTECNSHMGTCSMHAEGPSLPTSARVAVTTESPFLKKIYDWLVSGHQSVLRRFLPAKTPALAATNICHPEWGEYIKGEYISETQYTPEFNPIDSCVRSVVSAANYSYGPGAPTADHPSVPSGSGSAGAHIYFPYLGSVYDYFLGAGDDALNLQKMLRPKNVTSVTNQLVPSTAPSLSPGALSCNIPINSCSPVNWNSIQNYLNTVSNQYNLPENDNGVNYSLVNETWARDLINGAASQGLCPQFLLTLFIEETHGGAVGSQSMGCLGYFNSHSALPPVHVGRPDTPEKIAQYTQALADQISCVASYVQHVPPNDFQSFMCTYSGEGNVMQSVNHCTQFTVNPNFPNSICSIGTTLGIASPAP